MLANQIPDQPGHSLQFTRGRQRNGLISLTPLIDVVFMLLLFFMLTTSFQQWRTLELSPARDALIATATPKDAVTLTVFTDRVQLQGQPVSLNDVATRITSNKQRLIVTTDEEVVLQRLVTVLDALRDQGVDPILSIEP